MTNTTMSLDLQPSFLVGNIIPTNWYKSFTNLRGTPDLSLMSVLSEIVYWYRPKKQVDPDTNAVTYVNKFLGDAWQTSYEHFEKKFGFNREKIRRIFVKLEQMGICVREFRSVKLKGQTYNNRLFIHLSSHFLASCIDSKKQISNSENGNNNFFVPRNEGGLPHLEVDHIIDIKNKKNINKDRSIKSNFCKNSFFKKGEGDLRVSVNAVPVMLQTKTAPRPLEAFYPLSTEDARSIRISCGREFTLVAMNEILLDMSKRVKDRWFKSKKGFLSYMTKVFTYEKRDAVKIGNESFKIRGNKTMKEVTIAKQEEFLSQIEYSGHVSPEWHLKKKLCSVFERDKAYNLLSSFKHCHLEDDTFEIYLTKAIELSDWDKNIILQEAKASHEKCNLLKGMFVAVNNLKITVQENKQANAHCSSTSPKLSQPEQSTKVGQGNLSLPDNIWGTIRHALIQHHGDNGKGIDVAWFSKLEASVDETAKMITLKAPSSFFRDWIVGNYRQVLDMFIRQQQYSYEIN